jgi:hypothetical protein
VGPQDFVLPGAQGQEDTYSGIPDHWLLGFSIIQSEGLDAPTHHNHTPLQRADVAALNFY